MKAKELFKQLRNEENIGIFGAKLTTQNLIRRMKYLGLPIKSILVTNIWDNEIGIEGIPVKELDEVDNIKDFTVIIATNERYHDEIEELLTQKGVKKILKITSELNKEIVEQNNEIYSQNNPIQFNLQENIIFQYNINNCFKLEILKQKLKDGKKVKVLFLIEEISKFSSESLYKAMKEKDLFEPKIGILRSWAFKNSEMGDKTFNQGYNELKNKKYNIEIIDKINSIDELEPDIILYSTQYLGLDMSPVDLTQLNFKYLTCYIPYGINIVNTPDYHFNNFYINTSWINFEAMPYSYELNIMKSKVSGINAVSLGYPKLDNYVIGEDDTIDKRPIIIYAPHWTIKTGLNYSTFDKYYDFFENLRENHPEYFFVFKPHPGLKYRLYDMKINNEQSNISYEEYLEYCKRWNDAENGMLFEGTNYIELFKNSACLITDCGSFIAEYLPANKPCIYLFNDNFESQLNTYYDVGKEILSSYYLCSNRNEIEKIFEEVIVKGYDEKKLEREKLIREKFVNIGIAGEKICEYIEKKLQ